MENRVSRTPASSSRTRVKPWICGVGQLPGSGTDALADSVRGAVDLLFRDVERAVDQPALEVVDAVLEPTGQIVEVVHHLPDDEPSHQGQQDETAERRQSRGESLGHAVSVEAGHRRLEKRCDEDRCDQRECDDVDSADDLTEHPQARRDDEKAPPGLRRHAKPPRDHGRCGLRPDTRTRCGIRRLRSGSQVGGRSGLRPLPRFLLLGTEALEPFPEPHGRTCFSDEELSRDRCSAPAGG